MNLSPTKLLRRYGKSFTVCHDGEETESIGFLQRICLENGDEPFTLRPLGAVDERCWRLLSLSDVPILPQDTVLFDGTRYRVRDAAEIRVGGEISHYWAVCRQDCEAVV